MTKIKLMPWDNLKPIDLNKIQFIDYPDNGYIKKKSKKRQIVLHHTVSGEGHRGDIATWQKYQSRIAVHIIIARDGSAYQLYNSRYWGYHLGAGDGSLDKHSIAIELDNWGPLTKNGQTVYGNYVDTEKMHYPNKFRGYEYYEYYSDLQIKTAGELILYWHKTYGIPLVYHDDMWNISGKALNGTPGIWTHCSFRSANEKQDCHPQPSLKEMLIALKNVKLGCNKKGFKF